MILGIEMSSPQGFLSLVNKTKIICEKKIPGNLSHDKSFIPTLTNLLKPAGIPFSQIKGIGISIGPGSFTGIRIAIAAAYGLSFSTNIPLIGISTIDALLYQEILSDPQKTAAAAKAKTILTPIIEAKKNHFFSGFYKINKNNKLTTLKKPTLYAKEDLQLSTNNLVFGIFQDKFGQAKKINAKASTIAFLAQERLSLGKRSTQLRPIYLWDFVPSQKKQFTK